jgi:hypothetical protein
MARILEKKLMNIKLCVLIFSTSLSETFLILRRTEGDIIKNVYGSSCRVVLFSAILIKLESSRKFSKNILISNFMKICRVGAELFHVNGGQIHRRTDGWAEG